MPSILIQDLSPRDQYTATNAQTVFVYSFTLFDETDIEVYRRNSASVDADDYTQQIQLNIDYTVDLVGSTITLLSACSPGEIITIIRNMPDERLNLYTNGTVITADALNTDAESQVLLIQQNSMYDTILAPHYNKSAIIDDANPLGGDVILPVLEANEIWVKDPTNNFITTSVYTGGGGGGGNISGTGGSLGNIALWFGPQTIYESIVNINSTGDITNANSLDLGDLELAIFNGHTINSKNGQDLTLFADTGQTLNLGNATDPVTISGLNWPTADGTNGYFLKTDGAGTLSWATGGGGAPFASTKYNLVQFSDNVGGLQDSGIDYQGGVLSGPTEILVDNLSLTANTISATNTNGNITLTPDGTGVTQSSTELEMRSGNELRFYRTTNAFYTALKAGSPTANLTWTLPDADGAPNEVLTTDGSGTLSWSAGGGGGGGNWIQVGTATAANSATVDLISVFSATYTHYMIVARNVTFQTATDQFWMRVGTGVTPTWKSGASDYAYGVDGWSSGGSAVNSSSTGAAQILLATSVSSTTDLPSSLILNVLDPLNVSYKTPIFGQLNVCNNSTTLVERSVASSYLTAEAVSSVRFLASTGNIVTGTFEVYGFNPNAVPGGSIPSNVVQTIVTANQAPGTGVTGSNSATAVVITPSSATSRVRINFTWTSDSNGSTVLCLYRNGVALTSGGLYIGQKADSTPLIYNQYYISYVDSPATTSAVTYTMGAPSSFTELRPATNGVACVFIAEEIGAAP